MQQFLNEQLGLKLEVTGVFNNATRNAVMDFQKIHWKEILEPWVAYGLPSAQTPTGYVYKTTVHWIKILQCPDMTFPAPTLP